MPRSLFRKEAIDAQRQKFLGEASVAQPVRLWVYTTVACVIAAIVVAVAIWGQYTRRERVQGYLTSVAGVATVRMPDGGTVTDLLVKEGDVVAQGAPLARLSIDRSGVNDAAGSEQVTAEIRRQLAQMQVEREQVATLGKNQVQQARERVASLEGELRQADQQIRLQTERLESSKSVLKQWRDLKAQEYISPIYIQQKEQDVQDQEIKVQETRRQRASLAKDLSDAQLKVPASQAQSAAQLEQLDQRASTTAQRLAEVTLKREQDVKREMVIAAPIAGTVTNIAPTRGQTVSADGVLATLVPKDSPLQAELLVPTRAIGFVRSGQPVNLRYEAFPYERFGQYRGAVDKVGRTVLLQGDTIGPINIREPAYRVTVKLDRQTVRAGDEDLPLRAGMVVGADLLMEKRSLVEWLFQPVLQLRERIANHEPA